MLAIFFMFALSFTDEQPECIEVSLFAVEPVTRRVKQTLHFVESQEVTMKSDCFFSRSNQFDEKPIDILSPEAYESNNHKGPLSDAITGPDLKVKLN